MKRPRKRSLIGAILVLFACIPVYAQSIQFLPEIDAHLKLNSTIRAYLETKDDRDGGEADQFAIGPSLQFSLKPLIKLKDVAAFDLNDAKTRFLVLETGYRYLTAPDAAPTNRLETIVTSNFPTSQFGTQQTGIGGFVSQPTNRSQLLVNGIGGQMPRFQVHAITHNYDAIEGQPRFRAVPRDELIDGVLVDTARSGRTEAVENCRFTMIQVGQAKHSTTVIRLNLQFDHGDGPMPEYGTVADRRRDATDTNGLGILSAMA